MTISRLLRCLRCQTEPKKNPGTGRRREWRPAGGPSISQFGLPSQLAAREVGWRYPAGFGVGLGGGGGPYVWTIALVTNGAMIKGGNFTSIENINVNSIAIWRG